jgi:chorismate mutase-like protein
MRPSSELRKNFRYLLVSALLAACSIACDDAPQGPISTPAAEVRRVEESSKAVSQNSPDRNTAATSRLERLKADRLAIVDEVALWKLIRQKPIEDPARESAVLDVVEKRAADLGIDRVGARRFFESLMAEARNRQYELHERWRRDGPPADAREPDLDELRRGIDRLTPQLLEAWADSQKM